MKIIFLDIDGVLTIPRLSWDDPKTEYELKKVIRPEKIELLNHVINETNAKVVISSSWRIITSLYEIKEAFEENGFVGVVYDITPGKFQIDEKNNIWSQRGHEIQKWMDRFPRKIESFVIVDDNSDMVHLMDRLVLTNQIKTLQVEDCQKMIEMLNEDKSIK
jgi:16S rRNA C1402 (ribose-2'-O) methylase RsmI